MIVEDISDTGLTLNYLIRYLRATLGASHANLHPLATEFALLDDYLALMALRMGSRLRVVLDGGIFLPQGILGSLQSALRRAPARASA